MVVSFKTIGQGGLGVTDSGLHAINRQMLTIKKSIFCTRIKYNQIKQL
jgi:hypothetical protein